MSIKAEQETTITKGVSDTYVHVYSNVPSVVRRLQKDVRVITSTDRPGFFLIAADQWDPLRGLKRRRKPMTDEAKAATAARLAAARG